MEYRFYTPEQAAAELKLTAQQVRNLCRQGRINAERVGRSWVIPLQSLMDYYDNSASGVAENQPHYGSSPSGTRSPRALSFFSGAMGLDIGIEEAGFNTLLASETDNACRKTILKNKPEIGLIDDLRFHGADDVRRAAGLEQDDEIDLVVGGPPCQAFSTAGRRRAFYDDRGNVFLSFVRLITELRPKFAVIENVRGLLSAALKHRPTKERGTGFPTLSPEEREGSALNAILDLLEDAGYGVSFNLYNSANYGSPQIRERLILVCARDGTRAPYLVPTHDEYGRFGLRKWRTFRQAVEGLDGTQHHHVSFPEKRLRFYRMLGPGENWRALPKELQEEALGRAYSSGGGKTGFLRRLSWDKPSPTLVTHPAMPATDLAHPVENRPLSIEEYKRLQEFPDSWQIEGNIAEKYKQLGNAVPVSLGYAVGSLILSLLRGEEIPRYPGFRYSRYNNTSDTEWRGQYRVARDDLNYELFTGEVSA